MLHCPPRKLDNKPATTKDEEKKGRSVPFNLRRDSLWLLTTG